MKLRATAPLEPGFVVVDGRPMFHRWATPPDPTAPTVVHVHGFGISGTYLEPTAALLADRHRTYVPDLPGAGKSLRPARALDLPGLARALVHYCDAVGVERATFVGNSLGCPVITEVAASFPDRIEGAVLVSLAGGPNNQPLPRALAQMAVDGLREPPRMVPIAVRDYLHFGVLQSVHLFGAMTRYPTVERALAMQVPTTVVIGRRDPLVNVDRVRSLAPYAQARHLTVVQLDGAHALNFSHPRTVAALIDAHVAGSPITTGGEDDVQIILERSAGPAGSIR
jgi:pimeloyl-ACP methyl ester carboxylesterase